MRPTAARREATNRLAAAGFFSAYHCRASSASASASQSKMILRRTPGLPREEALLDFFPSDGAPLT